MRVDALVLAAGASTRLGQPKQAVLLHGQPLLSRAVATARAAVNGRVHAVLGSSAGELRAFAGDAAVHVFDRWQDGQHASLCFGVAQVSDADAVLVMPCDQYRIPASGLRALVDAWRGAPGQPAAARYDDTLGVPVIWPVGWLDQLARARRGQALLTASNCTVVALSEAAWDLDTPDDLADLARFEASTAG